MNGRTPPPGHAKTLTPYRPRTDIPGSKMVEAKRLLAAGASLQKAAEAVGLPPSVLDIELWRLLGQRLEPK